MATYATPAELADHLKPDPPPANGGRLLGRASRAVDTALFCAMYDVDAATGLPTKATVIAAFRDAALEQISYWLANGDSEGLGVVYNDVRIGSVQLRRGGSGAGTGDAGGLCEQAWQILAAEGLVGQSPRTSY